MELSHVDVTEFYYPTFPTYPRRVESFFLLLCETTFERGISLVHVQTFERTEKYAAIFSSYPLENYFKTAWNHLIGRFCNKWQWTWLSNGIDKTCTIVLVQIKGYRCFYVAVSKSFEGRKRKRKIMEENRFFSFENNSNIWIKRSRMERRFLIRMKFAGFTGREFHPLPRA